MEETNKFSVHKSVTQTPLCHLMHRWNKIFIKIIHFRFPSY